LKHFSLFERAKIGASAKKYEKGEGKERPIFAPPKSEKRLERAENPMETLATQAKIDNKQLLIPNDFQNWWH